MGAKMGAEPCELSFLAPYDFEPKHRTHDVPCGMTVGFLELVAESLPALGAAQPVLGRNADEEKECSRAV